MENQKKDKSKETPIAYTNISPLINHLEYIDGFRLNSPLFNLIEQMDQFRLNSPFSEIIEQMEQLRLNLPFSEIIKQMDEFRINIPFLEINSYFDNLINTEALSRAFENISSNTQENIDDIKFDNFNLENINEDDRTNFEKILDEISNLRREQEETNKKVTNLESSSEKQYDVQLYFFLLNLLLFYVYELIKMQS